MCVICDGGPSNLCICACGCQLYEDSKMTEKSNQPPPEYILKPLKIYEGKYTLHYIKGQGFRADRYGEPWRDMTGDGMILAMAFEIERLRDSLAALTTTLLAGQPKEIVDRTVKLLTEKE